MNKILIVGSGPAAFAFLYGITNFKNLDITLIDNSNIKIQDTSCIFYQNNFSGSRLNDFSSINEIYNTDSKLEAPSSSKAFGGFSNVWGGTIDNIPVKLKEKFDESKIDIEKEFEDINSFIDKISKGKSKITNTTQIDGFKGLDNIYKRIKSDKSFTVKFSSTAINKTKLKTIKDNIICDFCGSYRWACNNNTIWDSKEYISNLIEKDLIKYIPDTKLLSFEEDKLQVNCKFRNINQFYNEKFDKLIIAAGPIATSVILLNSKIFQSIEIKNSDLVQYPFLKLFRTSKKLDNFSDLFIQFKIEGMNFFSQIYFFSRGIVLLSKLNSLLKKTVQFIPNILLNNFGGAFIYYDQEISSSIVISKVEGKINFGFIDSKISTELDKDIKSLFRRHKIFFIKPLKNILKYGQSNHFGGQFLHSINLKDEFSSDTLGRVKNLHHTHIVDASVLPYIAAGPITIFIMANSLRISREIMKALR